MLCILEEKNIWLLEDGDHRERVNGALVGNVTQQAFIVRSQEKENVYWERSAGSKKKFLISAMHVGRKGHLAFRSRRSL